MPVKRAVRDDSAFKADVQLPYDLRIDDFKIAMQDVYDFFFDVNEKLVERGLPRLDDMLRGAQMSGMISDMITASLGKHSRVLTRNNYPNGHPDLIKQGRYPSDSVQAGEEGVEVKSTVKAGGQVDMHGARDQWLCVFVYRVDTTTEPAQDRRPMEFTEVYLAHVVKADFRHNNRGPLGTRTASLHREGIKTFRESCLYKLNK